MSKQMMSQTRKVSVIRGAVMALCAASALVLSPGASAGVLNWSIAGPGTTSVTQAANTASLNYALSGFDVYSQQTWTASAVALESGDYSFNWNYSGFHAFFNVTAFLNAWSPSGSASLVNAGPANCCSAPSNGFGYNGAYTFTNVTAGDVLRFDFGGYNSDSDARLQGTLALEQQNAVPEPASLALVGLALVGFAAARRRAN